MKLLPSAGNNVIMQGFCTIVCFFVLSTLVQVRRSEVEWLVNSTINTQLLLEQGEEEKHHQKQDGEEKNLWEIKQL